MGISPPWGLRIPAFLDFALAEARKTDFDIQTLGGTKHYLAGYLALRYAVLVWHFLTKGEDYAFHAAKPPVPTLPPV
jgi:hypothetical protein